MTIQLEPKLLEGLRQAGCRIDTDQQTQGTRIRGTFIPGNLMPNTKTDLSFYLNDLHRSLQSKITLFRAFESRCRTADDVLQNSELLEQIGINMQLAVNNLTATRSGIEAKSNRFQALDDDVEGILDAHLRGRCEKTVNVAKRAGNWLYQKSGSVLSPVGGAIKLIAPTAITAAAAWYFGYLNFHRTA